MATVLFAGANETVTLTDTFKVNGVATDPTTVTVTVTDPLGASTSYTWPGTVNRSGPGAFWAEVATPTPGEWSFTWTGTGTVKDVEHGSFTVLETALGHLYATPQQLKSRVGLAATDSSADLELHGACYAASRAVENSCSRAFWRTTPSETRTFVPDGEDLFEVNLGPFNDLVSVTSLATDLDADGVFETVWSPSDYYLEPVNPAAGPERRPYTRVRAVGSAFFPTLYYPRYWGVQYGHRDRVQITGVFGWPAVPEPVREATRMLAAQLFRMRDAPLGVASFGEIGVARVRSNPIVEEMLAPYRHPDAVGVLA